MDDPMTLDDIVEMSSPDNNWGYDASSPAIKGDILSLLFMVNSLAKRLKAAETSVEEVLFDCIQDSE
jgi:hypothetical protein